MPATPVVAVSLPAIVKDANESVRLSVKAYPGSTYKVTHCVKTSLRYGTCKFYVIVHSDGGKLLRCAGNIEIRNIGKGFEHRFIVKGCKDV
jgi:hypothetical protein